MFKLLVFILLAAIASVSTYAETSTTSFSIKAKASKGGVIAPSGKVPITAGQNLVFSIAPSDAAAYEIADVLVNGQSQGPVSQYTFSNVTSKQSILAKFKKKSYTQTITNSDPSLGTLSPQGSISALHGKTVALMAKPNAGYKAAITVDGVVVATGVGGKPLKYKLRVGAGHSVAAYFYNDATPLNTQRNVQASLPSDVGSGSNSSSESGGQADSGGTSIAPVNLAVKLNWAVPTARTNGDALPVGDITGYEVYYTSLQANVGDVVAVSGATLTSAVVTVPKPGIYYFSISTIDKTGEKSELSNPVQVTIQ